MSARPEPKPANGRDQNGSLTIGHAAGLAAFLLWGFVSVYWAVLSHVSALEIFAHRVIWAFVFLFGVLVIKRSVGEFKDAVFNLEKLNWMVLSAAVLGANNILFIWATTHERLLEASLGFFMSPLVSLLLAFAVLKERLTGFQKIAVLFAVAGVANLIIASGSLPWVALTLAGTFGFYGLTKKKTKVAPFVGLAFEQLVLLLPSLAYVAYLHGQKSAQFLNESWATSILLIGAGIITSIPLLLFAFAAKRISLTSIGFMQYIPPSVQFITALVLKPDALDLKKLATFALIWIGLAVYSFSSFKFTGSASTSATDFQKSSSDRAA